MSLLPERKPRPLKRDSDSLRDDRLFIIACDDTYAPKQYFAIFQIPRVRIHVVPCDNRKSYVSHVLTELLKFDHEPDDERWLLLDTDHCIRDDHFGPFEQSLTDARLRGIQIALSCPCFEVWLALHLVDGYEVRDFHNAADVLAFMRQRLPGFDKKALRTTDFPVETVTKACLRAEALDADVDKTNRPTHATSRVYLLWRAILSKALPSQLSPFLCTLRQHWLP